MPPKKMVWYLMALMLGLTLASSQSFGSGGLPTKQTTAQQATPKTSAEVRSYVLNNGMKVWISPAPYASHVVAWVVVNVGGVHNPSYATGLAHYIEHLFANRGSEWIGTIDYEAEKVFLQKIADEYDKLEGADSSKRVEILQRIAALDNEAARYQVQNELKLATERMGAPYTNAYTDPDHTAYMAILPTHRFDQWAELMANQMGNLVPRGFRAELGAVIQEKQNTYNDPDRATREKTIAALYPNQPYGAPNLGTLDHLQWSLSPKKVQAFVDTHYTTDNMTIVVAGGLDPETTLQQLEETFGKIPPRKREKVTIPPVTPADPKRVEMTHKGNPIVELTWRVNLPPKQSFALTTAAKVLVNGSTGALDRLKQEQKILDASAFFYYIHNEGNEALFRVRGVPREGQTLEAVEALLLQATRELWETSGITQVELDGIRRNLQVQREKDWEQPWNRVEQMTDALTSGMTWEEWKQWNATPLIPTDVAASSRHYIDRTPDLTLYRRTGEPVIPPLTIVNTPTPSEYAKGNSRFFAQVMGQTVTAPPRTLLLEEGKHYQKYQHTTGQWYVAPNTVNSLASVTLHWDYGQVLDPGICATLDIAWLSGTNGLSVSQYEQKLYNLGAIVNYSCSGRFVEVAITAPENQFLSALSLLLDRLWMPTLNESVIQGYAQDEMTARAGYTTFTKRNELLKDFVLYGDQSSQKTGLSSAELPKLTPATLLKSLQRLTRNPAEVYYFGNINWQKVAETTQGNRDLLAEPTPLPHQTVLQHNSGVYFFPADTASQSTIQAYFPAGQFSLEDWPLSLVLQKYLGGKNGLIFQEIRNSRSLAYAAHGGISTGDSAESPMFAWTSITVQAEKTAEALNVLQTVLRNGMQDPIRWQSAQKAAIEGIQNEDILPSEVAAKAAGWDRLGLTGDPRQMLAEQIRKLTVSEMEQFAQRITTRPSTIAITGNPTVIGKDLPPETRTLLDGEVTNW